MNDALIWIEATLPSRWLRESLSVFAFPTVIALHTLGLAFLAGPSGAIALRILGAARQLPLQPLGRFFPLMWSAFWLNAATGLALVLAYPTKALTNPLFYLKLVFVGLAVWVLRRIQLEVFGRAATPAPVSFSRRSAERSEATHSASSSERRARILAAATLVLWIATISSGRWLAYTYTRLLATH